MQDLLALGDLSSGTDIELSESVTGLVATHIKFREGYLREHGVADECEHVALLFDGDAGEIAGYGYGWHEPGEGWMELFAGFVRSKYRRRGIAMTLFREMVAIGLSTGVTRFIVRFAQPNEERTGFHEAIVQFARDLPVQASTSLWYRGQVTEIQGTFQCT